MAKEIWCLAEAKRILNKYKNNETIVFETGYGPSGLPHIGTFAEVARTSYVIDAVKYLKPSVETRLIVFSDDMDGLRKTPDTIPNKEQYSQYLGTPLCDIPDPFEKTESFSAYMNGQLIKFLDNFGFEYQFQSSAAAYRSGQFDEGLKNIFINREKVKSLFVKSISEEKRADWEPFFVTCEQCGKINTTRILDYHEEDFSVDYVCDNHADVYQCCQHKGRRSILKGAAKVGWKIDWALRWALLNICYEMHGEDLTDSAKMSAQICQLIAKKSPITYKYELFLDEGGKKISKKIGNGLSMEQWINLAPTAALAYFLVANPNKTKKMGLPILPKIIDEYLQAISITDVKEGEDPLWYIRKLNDSSLKNISPNVNYNLLSNLAESLSIKDSGLLYDYACNYDASISQNKDFYEALCNKVLMYLQQLKAHYPQEVCQPEKSYIPFLQKIKALIEQKDAVLDGAEMQTGLFSICKENDIPMREWFQFLYQSILNKNEGPKMGFFFALIGKEKSIDLINQALRKYS